MPLYGIAAPGASERRDMRRYKRHSQKEKQSLAAEAQCQGFALGTRARVVHLKRWSCLEVLCCVVERGWLRLCLCDVVEPLS